MAVPLFRFVSDAAGGDKFVVVNFTANESISSLYRYEIEVKAPDSLLIDLDDLLSSDARFISELNDVEYPVHGVLSSCEEMQGAQGHIYYKVVLVPRLWKLSTYRTNEIYTKELIVNKIIRTVLENADLGSGTDFDLAGLMGEFLERDYVCQFAESDFSFISRLMENEGIFYYFEQGKHCEKIIFMNSTDYAQMINPELIFDSDSKGSTQVNHIFSWRCNKQNLPLNVSVRDFNPEMPSLDIAGTFEIDAMGSGTEYLYGENILNETDASYIGNIRAEEFSCRKTQYQGEGSVFGLQSGSTFELINHPGKKYLNQTYLVIRATHEGRNLDSNKGRTSSQEAQYRNSFTAIESSVQFRPERLTARPRFYGTMTAFVYQEVDSDAAEVDEFGRYRVHLPFDRADGSKNSQDIDRKSSTWIRMAQPYVGVEQGMYFPLKGGTEVLLTFINGDPDRPVISGALANASEPSLLNNITADRSIISTPGNMHIEANAGQRVVMRIKES